MPESSVLAVFAVAALAMALIPGPNVVFILGQGIGQGRRAAVASALGVEAGTLIHVLGAALGISAIIASSAVAFDLVRYLGGAYLVVLGLRTIVGRGSTLDATRAAEAVPLRLSFRQGILVSALNPKIALFFVAFLPQFVHPSRGAAPLQIFVLGLTFLLIALAIDVGYALASGTVGMWLRRRPGLGRAQRVATGITYLCLGAYAAVSSVDRPSR